MMKVVMFHYKLSLIYYRIFQTTQASLGTKSSLLLPIVCQN